MLLKYRYSHKIQFMPMVGNDAIYIYKWLLIKTTIHISTEMNSGRESQRSRLNQLQYQQQKRDHFYLCATKSTHNTHTYMPHRP